VSAASDPRGRTDPNPAQPLEADKSLGQLLGSLTEDFGALVNTQLALAKVEAKEEFRHAARSAQMLGAGAVTAYFSALLALFALAWGLADAFDSAWLGFLVTAVVVGTVAAVLLVAGRRRLTEVRPMPQTSETLQEDVQWVKRQAS
jgi:uncharacterized membrane protein YqjE